MVVYIIILSFSSRYSAIVIKGELTVGADPVENLGVTCNVLSQCSSFNNFFLFLVNIDLLENCVSGFKEQIVNEVGERGPMFPTDYQESITLGFFAGRNNGLSRVA